MAEDRIDALWCHRLDWGLTGCVPRCHQQTGIGPGGEESASLRAAGVRDKVHGLVFSRGEWAKPIHACRCVCARAWVEGLHKGTKEDRCL